VWFYLFSIILIIFILIKWILDEPFIGQSQVVILKLENVNYLEIKSKKMVTDHPTDQPSWEFRAPQIRNGGGSRYEIIAATEDQLLILLTIRKK